MRANRDENTEVVASRAFDEMFDDCTMVASKDIRDSKSLVLLYVSDGLKDLALYAIYQMTVEQHKASGARVCVGRLSDTEVLIYLHKQSTRVWPDYTVEPRYCQVVAHPSCSNSSEVEQLRGRLGALSSRSSRQ